MDELTLNSEKYISSKRAAKLTGYTKDYVGQLCREGKIIAQLVGRNWYISESSIHKHRFELENSSSVQAPTVSKHVVKSASAKHHTLNDTLHYVHNEVNIIPLQKKKETVVQEQKINISRDLHKEEHAQKEKSDMLSTMQSAWQEWFTTATHEIKEDISALHKDTPKEEMLSKVEDDIGGVPKGKSKMYTGTRNLREYDTQAVLVHKIPSISSPHADEYANRVPIKNTYYKRSRVTNVINITLMIIALAFFVIALLNIFLSAHTSIYQLHYITGTSVYTAK